MTGNAWLVTVDKDIEALIPEYVKNRHQELEVLRTALAASDFEELRQRGHRMKGVGAPYGFEQVTRIGERIEDCAKSNDGAAIEKLVAEYADYLSRINIVYE